MFTNSHNLVIQLNFHILSSQCEQYLLTGNEDGSSTRRICGISMVWCVGINNRTHVLFNNFNSKYLAAVNIYSLCLSYMSLQMLQESKRNIQKYTSPILFMMWKHINVVQMFISTHQTIKLAPQYVLQSSSEQRREEDKTKQTMSSCIPDFPSFC